MGRPDLDLPSWEENKPGGIIQVIKVKIISKIQTSSKFKSVKNSPVIASRKITEQIDVRRKEINRYYKKYEKVFPPKQVSNFLAGTSPSVTSHPYMARAAHYQQLARFGIS